jgi:surfeit locus 1 family protein
MKTKYSQVFFMLSFIAIIASVLISLGAWQLQRLKWKEDLLRNFEANLSQPFIKLPNNFSLLIDKYKKIKINGHFLNDKEIHLYSGSRHKDGKIGYFILTPFQYGARYILVNRGFTPLDSKDLSQRKNTLIAETVEIEGMLMPFEEKSYSTLDNNPLKNEWLWVSKQEISQHTNLELEPLYLVEQNQSNGLEPMDIAINIRNNHLQYAITWFSFAAIFIIIFILRIKKSPSCLK